MVTKDQVVAMNYTLTDAKGKVLDQSSEGPLEYLHGHGNIIPGLEQALDGMAVGARRRSTSLPPRPMASSTPT